MGKPTGFLEIERRDRAYEKAEARVRNWHEFVKPLPEPELRAQAARCMDCGIPFCHNGCPVNNLIPDLNNLVYRHQWETGLRTLHSTNNFPEFTRRAAAPHPPADRGRGLGPGRACLHATAGALRTHRHAVREARPDRRPAAL